MEAAQNSAISKDKESQELTHYTKVRILTYGGRQVAA